VRDNEQVVFVGLLILAAVYFGVFLRIWPEGAPWLVLLWLAGWGVITLVTGPR
jgi:hypothetical protein